MPPLRLLWLAPWGALECALDRTPLAVVMDTLDDDTLAVLCSQLQEKLARLSAEDVDWAASELGPDLAAVNVQLRALDMALLQAATAETKRRATLARLAPQGGMQ